MKTLAEKILIVDGDSDYIDRLSKLLCRFWHRESKLEVLAASNEGEVRMQVKKHPDTKLILLDVSIECHDFDHFLNDIMTDLKVQVLIISSQPGNISGQEIVYKWDHDNIKDRIIAQLDDYDKFAKDSETSKTSLRQDIEYLMGKGKIISEVLDEVEKYAFIDEPLLIEGETGTGKELVVNYLGRLSDCKIITVNCGAVSEELINTELFGSKKGAFTGALNTEGKVKAVEGGILFLDEFNSLSLGSQVHILRLMENKTFTGVGDTIEHKANVKIIAASNKPCDELVAKGAIRQDLYERFVDVIYVPTLKERIEDIEYHITRFIDKYNKKLNKTAIISCEARKILISYDWTGNIRQLKNFIEVLVIKVEPDEQSKKYVIQPKLVRKCFDKRHHNTTISAPNDDYTLTHIAVYEELISLYSVG
jgi:DNA-binding NtrC family response regulator